MNILCVSDASDDGYEAAAVAARVIDRKSVNAIRIVLVAWPQIGTALWDKVVTSWLLEERSEDEPHQAVELTVQRELERFKAIFASHAAVIDTAGANGNPIEALLQNACQMDADLMLLAFTKSKSNQTAHQLTEEIIRRSPIVVLVAHAGNST